MTKFEENLLARFAYFNRAPQGRLYRRPEYTWFSTDITFPSYVFNIILQAQFRSMNSAYRQVDAIVEDCQTRRIPLFWCTGPSTRPVNLGCHLEEHNFKHAMRGQGMTMALDRMKKDIHPVHDFTVERVQTPQQLAQFVNVLAANANMPDPIAKVWYDFELALGFDPYWPRQRYLGIWQGKPIATSTIMAGAGVAGLCHVATLPEGRGQGIATAISKVALEDAYRLGYRTGVLLSTPMGVNVYKRLGFQTVEEHDIYFWNDLD